MDVSPFESDAENIEVGRFPRLAEARENALVLVAVGIPYVLESAGAEWVLLVEARRKADATRELGEYKREILAGAAVGAGEVGNGGPEVRYWSLAVVAWGVLMMTVVQAEKGADWEGKGILISGAVVYGFEWWRLFTALTLHGDVPHVLANLAGGLLFAGFLIQRFGQGVTWLLVLLSGGMGNLCNAWIYMNAGHRSLGASTGVFGALGLLTGDVLIEVLLHRAGVSWWRWTVPLGAGLALLSFLGAGGQASGNVDVLAHFWGFLTGLLLGCGVGAFRPVESVKGRGQVACGILALLTLAGSWYWALCAGKVE